MRASKVWAVWIKSEDSRGPLENRARALVVGDNLVTKKPIADTGTMGARRHRTYPLFLTLTGSANALLLRWEGLINGSEQHVP